VSCSPTTRIPDNLDTAGRALLADVPLTLTTPGAGQRLGGGAKGLGPLIGWVGPALPSHPGGVRTQVPASYRVAYARTDSAWWNTPRGSHRRFTRRNRA
jgi:hypothetical protein